MGTARALPTAEAVRAEVRESTYAWGPSPLRIASTVASQGLRLRRRQQRRLRICSWRGGGEDRPAPEGHVSGGGVRGHVPIRLRSLARGGSSPCATRSFGRCPPHGEGGSTTPTGTGKERAARGRPGTGGWRTKRFHVLQDGVGEGRVLGGHSSHRVAASVGPGPRAPRPHLRPYFSVRFSVLGVCSHARGLSGHYGASQRPSRPSVERIHALSSNPSAQNLAASTHPCALLIKILLWKTCLKLPVLGSSGPWLPAASHLESLRDLVPTHSGQPCAGRCLTYRVCR